MVDLAKPDSERGDHLDHALQRHGTYLLHLGERSRVLSRYPGHHWHGHALSLPHWRWLQGVRGLYDGADHHRSRWPLRSGTPHVPECWEHPGRHRHHRLHWFLKLFMIVTFIIEKDQSCG